MRRARAAILERRAPAFRFDETSHTYTDLAGNRIPNITSLLERAGWIDPLSFSEEACERGRAVHLLTARYDLGALDVREPGAGGRYRGWLLGHVKVVGLIRPIWKQIEVARVHRTFRLGGRADRLADVRGLSSVWEIKSGEYSKAHPIQTAMQAILVADDLALPPHAIARFAEYIDGRGGYNLEQHKDRTDFDEAYRILRKYAA